MSLMTYEEEEILHKVRHMEEQIRRLERICFEILREMKPQTYTAPRGFAFVPGDGR